jgi:hypothetical protein
MKKTKTRTRMLSVLLACAATAALFTAGPASAASRGYRLDNKSSHNLKLEGAKPLPGFVCNASICVETGQPMAFEGRPDDGSVLTPAGAPHAWELKYSFGYTYAAQLKYAIVGTGASVEYTIETSTYTNNSACKVVPASAGTCTAHGLFLSFKN